MSRTTETQSHTPEPWIIHSIVDPVSKKTRIDEIMTNDKRRIAEFDFLDDPGVEAANVRRAVACVNACAGIGTEALEQGAVAELVNALERICDSNVAPLAFAGVYEIARAAVDKVNQS